MELKPRSRYQFSKEKLETIKESSAEAAEICSGDVQVNDAVSEKEEQLRVLKLTVDELTGDIESKQASCQRVARRLATLVNEEQTGYKFLCPKAKRFISPEAERVTQQLRAKVCELRQQRQRLFQQQLAISFLMPDEFEKLYAQPSVKNPNYEGTECERCETDYPHDLHLLPQLQGLRDQRRYIFLRPQTEDPDPGECDEVFLTPSQDLYSKPMYNVSAIVQGYCAMQASIEFATGDGGKRFEVVIVDSGAANSGIGHEKLKKDYPALCEKIKPVPASMRFHDASGRPMPVVGVVDMTLCIQNHCFLAQVVVFQTLGCNFLLGTNTIVRGGLVIDATDEKLYVKNSCCSTPLHVGGPKQVQTTFYLDRKELSFASGEDEPLICACEETTFNEYRGKIDRRSPWSTMVLCDDTVVIPPRTKNVGVKCRFAEDCPSNVKEIEVNPGKEFLTARPELRSWRGQRHLTHNKTTFLQVSNLGKKPLILKKDELVGEARAVWGAQDLEVVPGQPDKVLAVELGVADDEELPFSEGGRPRTREDLHKLGFTLEKAIDPSKPLGGGKYAPLADFIKERIYQVALRWHHVWARDARTPRISRLVIIDIPTGDATPIQQKPYGIPRRYLEAVREEIDKLLKAGLIEPSFSNWASPTLLTVKKDSTADKLKVKVVCDYRRLNEVTIPDSGGLGTQQEILDSFGGGRKYSGIADAAGGFYQYLLNPLHKERSTFCLPAAMGGTTFQWRVAPYGLQRNPASYSRGMMFALQGMVDMPLMPMGQSRGTALSWVDDITMTSDTMEGFIDLFEQMLMRMSYGGLSLKAEKCWLLREELEVLGFLITPEHIKMNPDKTNAIKRMAVPSNIDEVRTYLGMVGFYRRFVPRLGLLATPMFKALTKDSKIDMVAVTESFHAINEYLLSDAVVYAPDFRDPLAAFAIIPDASNVAAGAALMQWQHPSQHGPGPTEDEKAGEKSKDELTQSWRLDKGWQLRTIGFFSKTFVQSQKNWPTFDKEAGAIVLALRHWVDIVTGCHTTVYTDSSVAASMLATKHAGPPRLQRWGVELMTFLPYLRIAYRKGVDQGLADLLSRYPTFKQYCPHEDDEAEMPDDLFEKIGETPTSISISQPKGLGGYALWECKKPKKLDEIWQERGPYVPATVKALQKRILGATGSTLPLGVPDPETAVTDARDAEGLVCSIEVLRKLATATEFSKERQRYEEIQDYWQQYVSAFETSYGRKPVLYDLYCGEGCYTRGARLAGVECYGIDSDNKCRQRYETDYALRQKPPTGSKFACEDLSKPEFWDQMSARGRYGTFPAPDVIHASPPCTAFSRLTALGPQGGSTDSGIEKRNEISQLLERLVALTAATATKFQRKLIWQVENVTESFKYLGEKAKDDYYTATLCGTMFGHQVFKHRAFYANYPIRTEMAHEHEGKLLGDRGIKPAGYKVSEKSEVVPNMYGVYSRPSYRRGTMAEWHSAMGHPPKVCSAKGIVGCLPSGYGRYLTAQMVAHALSSNRNVPVMGALSATQMHRDCLKEWAIKGHTGVLEPLKVIAPVMLSRYRNMPLGEGVSVGTDHVIAHIPRARFEPYPKGTRVEVYWPRYAAWYSGTVEESTQGYSQPTETDREPEYWNQIKVVYDLDSERHWHTIGVSRVRRRRKLSHIDGDELTQAERETLALRSLRVAEGEDVESTDSESEGDSSGEEEYDDSRWKVTREDQLADPWSGTLLRNLERTAPKGPVEVGAPPPQNVAGNATWAIQNGLLVRLRVGADNEVAYQVAAPEVKRKNIMMYYHFLTHRSGNDLFEDVYKYYYWPKMEEECINFKAKCGICGERASVPRPIIGEGTAPTPELPFSVLHLDCKLGLTRSGGYNRVLVIVCALTRYTIYVPMSEGTGAAIFRALYEAVFKYFGVPKVIICDNGSEFRNNLMAEMAQYMGYRKVHVKPYTPQANGIAEAAVKRLKMMLDKITVRYKDWHKSLPAVMLLLNTSYHPGIKMTPYYAVFGREAVRSPALEGPMLPSTGPTGSVFLRTFHSRIADIHDHLFHQSHEIRALRHESRNAKNLTKAVPKALKPGDYVWMIFRDWEKAAYMRKYGKGQPWKRRFKVEEVHEPYGVKLDVSTAPGVQEWQSRRRVVLAPSELHDLDELNLQVAPIGEYYSPEHRRHAQRLVDDTDPDGDAQDIRQVVTAQFKGDTYEVTVLRGASNQTDVLAYQDALEQCRSPELRKQLENEVSLAKLRAGLEADDDDGSEDGEVSGGTDGVFAVTLRDSEEALNQLFHEFNYHKKMIQAMVWLVGDV